MGGIVVSKGVPMNEIIVLSSWEDRFWAWLIDVLLMGIYSGQSLGKMLFNIVVTGPLGESIRFRDAALEGFGKAFLLLLDCVACWFFFRKSRQRLFNRISNTIVIKRTEY